MKKKIILVIFILLIILIAGGSFSFFVYQNKQEEIRIQLREEKKKKTIKTINSHYSSTVITNKEAKLYDKDYKEFGSIGKDEILELGEVKIDEKTKYFYIKNLDLNISYKDVDPTEEKLTIDERYKKYLLFDLNITSKENVKLYDKSKEKVVYTLNNSIDVPVIVKDDDGVFIEYYNRLLFVKNEDIASTYDKANNTLEETNAIPVTCYHFIYLPGDNTCNEIICHSKEQIESHFTYLTENNYFTINTTELRLFIEGKLRLPKNTILITIDDGARAENFIPLLEQYKLNATLFLVSSWYPKEKFASPYMEIASHTHNLHDGGVCSYGQGGGLTCLPMDQLVDDLTKSRETLDGTEALCYPFYEFNDHSIEALKKAGFKMGFAGGQKKATRGIDLYKIPRITIHNSTTLNEYINFVN